MVMNIINAQAPSLYFSATGPGNTGPDLYRIAADGTLTPIPVDPGSTAGSNAGENGGYANFNGKLYFFANTADGPAQLLALNPDGTITPITGLSGVPNSSDSQLPGVNAHFTVFDGKLFFVAQGPQGVDIYTIDTNGNVGALDKSGFTDPPVVAGDNVNIYSNDNGFAIFDGGLYFSAQNFDFGIPSLYRLDPGSNTPVIVGEASVAYVGEDGGFAISDGMLIFNGWPFDTGTDSLVGLAAGSDTPQTLTDVFGNPILHTFLTPSRFHGEFFIATDNYLHSGDALYVNQGGNISELHDPLTHDPFGGFAPYGGPGLENGLIDFNGSVYFSANGHLNRLSFSSGTAIIAGVDDTAGEDGGFVVFNNKLYFFAQKNFAPQLYSVDATDHLTAIAGVSGSFSGDAHFTVFENSLYLEGPTTSGIELIRIDSAGVVHVSDINAGGSSFPGATGGFAIFKPATVGTAGDDQINGTSDGDDIDGAGGNDIINAGGGDDIIRYTVGQGHDVTDGGAGSDTLKITGTSGDEAYGLWTVAAYNAAHAATPYSGSAEILLTVNGSIVNEIKNVEEITLTANGGTDSLDVEGNFTATALTTSTITYQGGDGTDTVDLSHRASGHSVVGDAGAGTDTAILGFAFHGAGATFQKILDGSGNLVGAKITHTVGGQSVTDTLTNFESFVFTDGTRTLPLLFDDPPVAAADKVSVNEDNGLVIAPATLLANDTDPNNDALTVTAVANASHGAVTLDDAHDAIFVPEANFSGVAGFDYTTSDGKGGFSAAHVTVDVAPKADPVNLHLATGSPGNDFLVSNSGAGEGAVAALPNGNFVVAWVGAGVSARIVDPHGVAVTTAFNVSNPPNGAFWTHVTALSDGDFVVAWETVLTFSPLTTWGVSAQRFHADGTAVGGVINAPFGSDLSQNNPSVAATSDGGFVITWEGGTLGSADVTAQRYDANGNPVGAPIAVFTPDVSPGAIDTAITGLEGGGFVVGWGFIDGSARVFNAQGQPLGPAFVLGAADGHGGGFPALAALAGGGFVAQWTGDGLWAQIFDARGVALRPAFEIDPSGNTSGVTALPNGGFVSIWTVRIQGVTQGILGQQYDAAGNAVGNVFHVDQPDTGFLDLSTAPNSITTLANGDVAVTWMDGKGGLFANIIPTGFHTTASGTENHLVTLSTIGAALNDTDGSETLKLVLSGFPSGATFSVGHAGSGPDAGKWVIDDANQIAGLCATSLKMTPPTNYAGSFVLHVDAVATDSATLSDTLLHSDTRTTGATIDVTIAAPNPVTVTTTPNASAVTLSSTTPAVLTDTAILAGGISPTGTITFTLLHGGTVVDAETVTVNGDGTYTTPTGFALPSTGTVTGTYQWNAAYGGDGNNSPVSELNDPTELVTVSAASPTLSTAANPGTVVLSGTTPQILTDSATLAGGFRPTGAITFTLLHGGIVVDTETVAVNGNGTYTPTGFALPSNGTVIGTYQWNATYTGDGNNNGASDQGGSTELVTVNAASPTLNTTPSVPAVTLGASTVILTDTATLAAGFHPGGTITFSLLHDGSVVDTEIVNVTGNGSYTTPTGFALPSSGTVTGTYQWSASYSGDANNNGAGDQGGSAEQTTVSAASPALNTTPNPTTVALGASTVILTDSAMLVGGFNPGGNIVFTLTGPGGFSYTQTDTVSGNGTYTASTTLPTTGTVAGTYTWAAHYLGDGNNNGASDQGGSAEQVTVSAANPALSTTPNATAVTLGTSTVILTDTAVLSGSFHPGGTITFTLLHDGTLVDTETVTVSGNGSYTTPTGFTLPSGGTVTGTYQWSASYSGDGNNNTALDQGGSAEQVTVSAASPTLTTTDSPSAVTLSTTTPSILTDTATLTGGFHPGGTIIFTLSHDGTVVDTEMVTVTGNGSYTTPTGYTLPITADALGTYQWSASYSGDGNNNTASDQGGSAEQVTVSAPDLAMSKTVNNATPNVGDQISFTVTLSNLGSDTATGVQVSDLLPAGLDLVTTIATQGTYDHNSGVWTVGTVTSGYAPVLIIVANVVSPNVLTNTASISHADQFDPDTANNSASATETPQQADLSVTKTVDDAAPNVGDTVTYTVTLSDAGPDAATNVQVADLVPSGVTFVSATPSQGSYDHTSGLWAVGTVNSGTTQTLTITAQVDSPDALTNTASISHADQFDPDTANNSSSVTETPNNPPVAHDSAAVGNEDTTVFASVQATDADNDPLTYALVQQAAHGTVALNPDGTFSYTPNADYNGADSFTFQASDGPALSNVATVSLFLNPVNDAPVAQDSAFVVSEDTKIFGTVTASDVDGDPLTYTLVQQAAHGSLTLNPDGTFVYTPNADYNGTDSFTFKVNDGPADSNVATVSLFIEPVNDAPVAQDGAAAGHEDTKITGTAIATDVDGDPLTYTLVHQAAHGSVMLNLDGTFSYTPNAGYNGTDSFTFKASDGPDDSNVATISLTIDAVNDAPVASDGIARGNEDTKISGTVTASDVDGDSLTYALVQQAAHGVVTLNPDGTFSYTPNADYNGTDSFTFKANDGSLDSNTATVSLTIDRVNDVPVAQGGSAHGTEDTKITGAVTAGDVDGDSLTYALVQQAAHGAVTLNPDGTFSYTPNANYNGTDSFTFRANDGTVDSNVATISLTIDPVNDAPVAQAGSARGNEDSKITGVVAANDVDGDSLTYALVQQAAHGTVTLKADGTFSYTPNADYNGTDSFTFKANDGSLDSNVATVSLTIDPVNDAPIAQGGSARGNEDSKITGAVAANDVDHDPLTYALVQQAAHGTVTLKADGTFSYTPNADYNGTDSFTFKANDGSLDSNVATISLTIDAVNDAPVVGAAVKLTAIGVNSGPHLITQADLLANAHDVDGPSLTAANLAIAKGLGTLADNHDGTWTYTPKINDDTGVTFAYQVTDGSVATADSATLDIVPAQSAPAIGSPGDDTFTAVTGNAVYDGLGGVDTIIFNFRLTEATVAYSGNQVIIDGPTSHTVLTGFEIYKFTDGTVNDNDGDPLVDDLFYYAQNHDVWLAGADADAHYHTFGWKEGRDPDAFFSNATYWSLNPSTKGSDPLMAFDHGGWKSSDPSIAFDIAAYLKANPDVAAAGIDPLAHFLQSGAQEGRQPIAPITLTASNGFDYVYYLQHNPDVAAAHVDPFQHYETVGWKEGRNPNAYFDVNGYLAHNPDVAAAGINPLDHYDQVGWKEGRDPSPAFDTKAYLAAYPDVAAAHVDPLEHFLKFGIAEGRTPHGDGVWG